MPRGGVDFEGIGQRNVSVKLHSAITVAHIGKAVAWVGNGEVGLGVSGAQLAGKLIQVEGDGYGTLAYAGFMALPYLAGGTAPVVGKKVVVDGAGNVKLCPEQAVNEGGSAQYTITEKGRGLVVSLDPVSLEAWVQL